ncbi:MAG: hypothetical protein AVDCRST_MAG95-3249, partial [uncultured Adhaeribacter sp.]
NYYQQEGRSLCFGLLVGSKLKTKQVFKLPSLDKEGQEWLILR